MDDISMKRELVKKAYPTKTWKTRVEEMPDSQIIAVFLRLRGQRKI